MARASKVAAASGADLPDRIVRLMASAPYASFVVRRDSDRTLFLPEIISLHTRRELLDRRDRPDVDREDKDLAGTAWPKVAQAR